MGMPMSTRRRFLLQSMTGLGSAWVTAHWPEILCAHDHAQHAAAADPPAGFEFFTPEQATEVEAMAAQIIPADESPGAREARVIYFIDRALATFDRDKQAIYASGLGLIQSRTRELFPHHARFSAASDVQQITILRAIEKSEFFETTRIHTIAGFFCDPGRGGNYGQTGWQLIGFDGAHANEAPFGHYDSDYPGWQPSGRGGEPK